MASQVGQETRRETTPPDSTVLPDTAPSGKRVKPRGPLVGGSRFFPTLFFVYVVATLAVMVFFVPPFMKADEPAHFHRTISLTNLDFVCSESDNGNYFFELKRKWVEAPELMHVWDVWIYREVKFDRDWLKTDFSDPKYEEPVFLFENCNLPPVGYLPVALGALAGKPFESPLYSLYLGRLGGAIFFLVALAYALRVAAPHYRPLLYLFGGMPTVLHQASAVSYDPVQLALFAVIFALLTKFTVEDQPIKPSYLLAFMFALVWAVNIRLLTYLPLLLLIGAVRPANIASEIPRYLRTVTAFAVGSLMIATAITLVYLPRLGTGFSPDGIDARAQLRYIASDPLEFIATSYRTVDLHGDWLLKQTIGVFGWTDTPLSFFPYYAVLFVAGMVIYRLIDRDVVRLGRLQIAALLATVGLTIISLFVSLYAVWSPLKSDVIDGLQGRYFIGLIPFFVLGLSQLAGRVGRMLFVRIAVLVAVVVLFVNIVRSIDVRYYG